MEETSIKEILLCYEQVKVDPLHYVLFVDFSTFASAVIRKEITVTTDARNRVRIGIYKEAGVFWKVMPAWRILKNEDNVSLFRHMLLKVGLETSGGYEAYTYNTMHGSFCNFNLAKREVETTFESDKKHLLNAKIPPYSLLGLYGDFKEYIKKQPLNAALNCTPFENDYKIWSFDGVINRTGPGCLSFEEKADHLYSYGLPEWIPGINCMLSTNISVQAGILYIEETLHFIDEKAYTTESMFYELPA